MLLHGARLEEDASVHSDAVKLLNLRVLQQNLESIEFVYTPESHGGWFYSEDLLKDNVIWETLANANYPRLEELCVREMPYGTGDKENILYHLTHWKRISLSTQAFLLDDVHGTPDYDPFTVDMFGWLCENPNLTHLNLELKLDEGCATIDSVSVTSLLEEAVWPNLISLSIFGGECHDFTKADDDGDEQTFDYGTSPSVQKFLLAHPQIQQLSVGICASNDLRGPQTVPFASLPAGVLGNLQSFSGTRNHVEDLALMYGRHDKLKYITLRKDFAGMGWDSEEHAPPAETFLSAMNAFPNLTNLELDFSYEGCESGKGIEHFIGGIAGICPGLRLILRNWSPLDDQVLKRLEEVEQIEEARDGNGWRRGLTLTLR
ncbi:hypothetical protein BT69DRAFT_1352863 [Atractiella rhizophila]|nr:hypothetical protein BT69DRAFT_1352863 [Atractiella rhizophila]